MFHCNQCGATVPRDCKCPPPEADMVHITMTRRAAEFYALLLIKFGGEPSGPRGEIVDAVTAQLEAQGIRHWELRKDLTLSSYLDFSERGAGPLALPYLAARWPEQRRK